MYHLKFTHIYLIVWSAAEGTEPPQLSLSSDHEATDSKNDSFVFNKYTDRLYKTITTPIR